MSSMMRYWEEYCHLPVHTCRKKNEEEVVQNKEPCEDSVARISTDMMQIQTVPRLQENVAYYKSKVNKVNEISTPNK